MMLSLLAHLLCIAAAEAIERVVPLKRQTILPSSTSTSIFVAPTASPAPNINSSIYDIPQHFCRIWRHASTYADGKIYIDGGNTYVPNNNGTFYNTDSGQFSKGMNNHLVVIDLSADFSNQDTSPYSTIHKGPGVPSSLIEHTLWYSSNTRKIYQLGGWFSFNNVNDPGFVNLTNIPESAIWEFNIDAKIWSIANEFNLINTGAKIDRPGAAAYCDAPTLNMSFVFEGYVQQRSDQDYINYAASADFKFLEGMLSLDTRTSPPTLSNISVPEQQGGVNFGPRMNGAMVHVPIGKYGVIVMIGGQMTMEPTDYGVQIVGASGKNTNVPMTFVDLYDIESGNWLRQETFSLGDGWPSPRSDICTVVVPASDNSSFNIYMIAGVEDYSTYSTSEEIWVLTLPTFQWTLVHSRADGMFGHSCHVVGENLLIVGGMQTHDGKIVTTCSSHMPAEIFSLVTQNYTGRFDSAGAKRLAPVPTKVVQAIGGTTSGGAYVTAPKAWSDLYLQYVFNPSLIRPAYKPTYTLANATAPADSGSSPSKNTIIGAAVGGGVGLILLIVLVVIFTRRHRRRLADQRRTAEDLYNRQSVTSELPAYTHDAKFDTGPVFRGVTSMSVSQADGPAELHSQGSFQQSPRPTQYGSELQPHSPGSMASHSMLYAMSEGDRAESSPGHDHMQSRSISPQTWVDGREDGSLQQGMPSPDFRRLGHE